MAELNAARNTSIGLKTYNQSNIEPLSKCKVKIRHNDKCVKWRSFVVPGDGQALLGMPDMELLSIIRVLYETVDKKNNWQEV